MSYSYFAGVVIVCCCREGGENVVKKQTSGNLALEQRRVIVIPAHDEIIARKLRVAAYARVSSSSEDQLNSYRVQNQYYDWAKIRFTSQFRPKLSLKKKDPATIQLGYDGTLEDVFTGFVSGNYDGGTYANEVALKDEMLLMEETIINDTFLDTTPQELISYFLAQAGLSKMKLSSKTYPTRKMLPIRRQTAVQAINAVNAAWGLRVPFFFSGGVFYWDEKPEQKKVYTFERGVNILNLRRAGGVWELETVSAPFIKHSHKINLIHPQVSGEVEVSKVVSKTNDSGFIRTYIYF